MKAAIETSAANAQSWSLVPRRASKTTRASSAGPTKFAMLKTTMYQRGRERSHSGKNAIVIAIAASAGGRIRTAAKIGASDKCEPWCFCLSAPTRCTTAMSGRRMQKASRWSLVISSGQPTKATPATVSQTTANSRAAAAGLSPPIVRSEPARIEQIVPERASLRIPISGDKWGFLDPSNE
jgi:hypothetical protein